MDKFEILLTILDDGSLNREYVTLEMNDKNIREQNKRQSQIERYMKFMRLKYSNKISAKCLCWECLNCFDCPKILDLTKKDITKYPFITSGYQIRDLYFDAVNDSVKSPKNLSEPELDLRGENNLHIVKFLVTGCRRFKAEK